jgi:hypothetical protein
LKYEASNAGDITPRVSTQFSSDGNEALFLISGLSPAYLIYFCRLLDSTEYLDGGPKHVYVGVGRIVKCRVQSMVFNSLYCCIDFPNNLYGPSITNLKLQNV